MSQSTSQHFSVPVALGIKLSLTIRPFEGLPTAYSVGIYCTGYQLAFTAFDLKDARVEKGVIDSCLRVGRTCYVLPTDSVDAVASFLGIAVSYPKERAS